MGHSTYAEMMDLCRQTWIPECPFPVLFAMADPNQATEASLTGDLLCTKCPDTLAAMLRKTKLALRYLLDHTDFDFCFRACCCSYVIGSNLIAKCATLPRTKVYSGITSYYPNLAARYVSGSGMLLSRDMAAEIAHSDFDYSLDDAGIGKLLGDKASLHTDGTRVEVEPEGYYIAGCREDGQSGRILGGPFSRPPAAEYHFHVGKRPALFQRLHTQLKTNP